IVSSAMALGWQDIQRCIMNPCDCPGTKIKGSWKPDGRSMYDLSGASYQYSDDTFQVPDFPSSWSYQYKVPEDLLCPPYNKKAGRRNCLVQFEPPMGLARAMMSNSQPIESYHSLGFPFYPNIGNYSVYCAEADTNTNFHKPTIRLRLQNCNISACWTHTTVLSGKSGQCITLPSPTGLPTTRFCARVALPSINDPTGMGDLSNMVLDTDPGYKFHYLDTKGFPRPDTGIPVSEDIAEFLGKENAEKIRIFLPKICLYEDPAFYQTLMAWLNPWYRDPSKLDLYDLNPNKMLYHTNTQNTTPGFMDVLTNSLTRNDVVESDFFFKPGTADKLFFPFDTSNVNAFDPEKDGVAIMGQSIDMRWKKSDNDYINWVKDFVYNKKNSLGCVFMPLGPFPPPFCEKTPPLPSYATLQRICPQEVQYDFTNKQWMLVLQDSTYADPCVKSNIRNNFIYNSVRLSMDKFIPICTSSQDPAKDDCVKIYPQGYTSLGINESYNDTLPVCSSYNPSDGNPCVISRYSANNCIGNNCLGNARIVYGYKEIASSSLMPIYGYPSDTKGDCGSTYYPCRAIYGINVGQYSDISLDLSGTSINYSSGYSGFNNVTLSNQVSGGINHLVPDQLNIKTYVSYLGENEEIDLNDITLDGNSICSVFYTGIGLVGSMGCVPRAEPPLITGTTCTSSNCPLPYENKYSSPYLRVTFGYTGLTKGSGITTLPSDSASQVVGLISPTSSNTDTTYSNFLGAFIETIASDNTYVVPPYYGSKVYNQGGIMIFGNYVDATNQALTSPLLSTGESNTAARYIGGLEYNQDGYFRGGTWIGAAVTPYTKCHSLLQQGDNGEYDDTNCVLAKRYYYDQVDCAAFAAKQINTPCAPANQSSVQCNSLIDSLKLKSGSDTIRFYSCSDNSKCYVAPTSMSLQVCAISTNPVDRVDPLYNGSNLATPLYYDVTNLKYLSGICATTSDSKDMYNNANCGQRDKTIFERGAKGEIPQATCIAEGPAASTGYATWTSAVVGANSTGTCMSGYKPPSGASLPARRCYQTSESLMLNLEPITEAMKCIPQ
ncbi:MAG: hypothetical protein EB127_08065, partial [Alphaproteobacteria bacterium]|nr:hypothetical protein [Alphaproteobacteria bacterium]